MHFRISSTIRHINEREIVSQEKLDIKCIKLIRGFIHNEIVKLPTNWLDSPKLFTNQLKTIVQVQNALNSQNAVLAVLTHLIRNNSEITKEVLAFLAAMLFGGNEKVQSSLINYFLGTREENFFQAIKNRIQCSCIAIKEKRSLMAQHQEKIRINVDQVKALRKAMQQGKGTELTGILGNVSVSKKLPSQILGSSLLDSRILGSTLMGSRMNFGSLNLKTDSVKAYSNENPLSSRNINKKSMPNGGILGNNRALGNSTASSRNNMISSSAKLNQVGPIKTSIEMTDKELEAIVKESLGDVGDLDYIDDSFINLVLKMLGLMCDGQNNTLQDYLREQPDNINSVNLVAETARFLGLLYSSINPQSISLVTELLSTLVEFTSGNSANQTVVFDNKIIDYINFILRGGQFQACDEKNIYNIKMAVINLLISLVEERSVGGHGVADDVAEAIDKESIFQVCIECFKRKDDENVINLGFKYYRFLLTTCDIKSKTYIYQQEHEIIWKFYNQSTLSIEILKGTFLTKHFL